MELLLLFRLDVFTTQPVEALGIECGCLASVFLLAWHPTLVCVCSPFLQCAKSAFLGLDLVNHFQSLSASLA